MSVQLTLAAFQAGNANIAGVVSAPKPEDMPARLVADQLPCAITLPGQATHHQRPARATRRYALRFYIAPVDSDAGETFSRLLALLEAATAYWRAAATINGYPIRALEDAGALRTIAYGGEQFYGFELGVTIEEVA